MKRFFIKIEGIVQGVGFRPFVYNQAALLNLKGWVNNTSYGVCIDIEGEEDNLNIFIYNLKYNHPTLAMVENIVLEEKGTVNHENFQIRESSIKERGNIMISPDIAVCEECLQEVTDPLNKRYKYPFANCTNCGPRFSIIKSAPYDRCNTTMDEFYMCKECNREYIDQTNRRFHAQPNSCEKCGPSIWIEDSLGVKMRVNNVLEWTRAKLKEGKIFAVKGIGGYHLVCDAANEEAVNSLRLRKNRPDKPFAVMIKDIETIKKYCFVSKEEECILKSRKKPIVILKQKSDYDLTKYIAPNQKTLGVMLPYTPLHYLLLEGNMEALIMTSANSNGLPLEYKNESAVKNLGEIVDYFLHHNRGIHIPIDDSVVQIIDNDVRIIRRARGYTPEPIRKDNIKNILACGSNMKNTFCIAKDNFLFLSQHNGDLKDLETIEYYKNNIEHFKNIFSFIPEYIACDMHPRYASSEYAYGTTLPKIEVQHHHAHIVSCLAENNIKNKVIGIAFDGTGYGTDGKIWGGEFFLCDNKDFQRVGHIDYVKMPGGEKAIIEPWRMAVSYIYKMVKSNDNSVKFLEEILDKLYGQKAVTLVRLIKSDINCPETSSMGRLFDAAANLIIARDTVTYEGQAAIELEAIIDETCIDFYAYEIIKDDNYYIIKPEEIIMSIIEDKFSGKDSSIISAKFHNTIVKFSTDICKLIRQDTGVNEIALSGGVFQNAFLLENLVRELMNEKFVVYTNKLIPTNDAGLSIGQIIIANEILKI